MAKNTNAASSTGSLFTADEWNKLLRIDANVGGIGSNTAVNPQSLTTNFTISTEVADQVGGLSFISTPATATASTVHSVIDFLSKGSYQSIAKIEVTREDSVQNSGSLSFFTTQSGTQALNLKLNANGSATVSAGLTVVGDLTASANLAVTGNSTVGGDLDVTGAASFGSLNLSGLTASSGDVQISAFDQIDLFTGGVNPAGGTKVVSFDESGSSILAGDLTIADNLAVTGNATITGNIVNPVFSPVGGKASLSLGRDLNLKIVNGATAASQVAITFDYLTLYSPTGLAAVETRTSTLTLNLLSTGAGARAASENSGDDQASTWYYIYVYSDGAGTINGLLAQASDWATVISNGDNPSGSGFVRRVGAIRNGASGGGGTGDLLYYSQVGNSCGLQAASESNMASNATDDVWVSVDISSLVPTIAIKAKGFSRQSTAGESSWVAPTNLPAFAGNLGSTTPGVRSMQSTGSNNRINWECDIVEEQVLYIAQPTGDTTWCLTGFSINL